MLTNTYNKSPSVVRLKADGWEVKICPKFGAAILSCKYNDQHILQNIPNGWLSEPEMFETGHFPLLPYSNRIGHGRFTFQNVDYNIRRTRKDETHPLHGVGWQKPWRVETHSENALSLSLHHIGEPEVWPWTFSATHTFRIKDDQFVMTLSITNQSESAMPTGLGFHPYFADYDQISFQTDGTHIQDTGSNNLPLPGDMRELPKVLSDSRKAADFIVDNCFSGGRGTSKILWENREDALLVKASKTLPFTVIYSNPKDMHFCIEPVSHINNALNLTSEQFDTGLVALEHNDTLDAQLSLTMET